ncbi:unnamed protein product [Clonostachys rhizophaga]|uniref:Uncharacterized protein n=1 Tax=Clonostachys rhizophaga TaxID=160324 RepID=A0A9N9YB89_9HYPO|nr:unnamed protein product [Clonostachys rhizophaga]
MSVPYRSGRDYPPNGGLADGYYDPSQYYGDRKAYDSDSPPRSHRHRDDLGRPSRRHKSEHRRAPADAYDDAYEKPSRRRSRRDPGPDRPEIVHDPYYGKKHSAHDPTSPSYSRETERSRRRDEDRDREHHSRRHERRSMPPPTREPYDSYPAPGYSQDRKSDRRSKKYRAEPEPRSSRHHRRPSPSPEPRPRRHEPPMPRSKGGHYRDYDDHYGAPPPRRARSHERPKYDFDRPSRGRPDDHGSSRSKEAPTSRRKSVPASPKNKGNPWWQNPMLQAGARYAFTAGAQAALRNKDEQGPWMGPKGAKVATAALSAALVDGIIAQKQGGDGGRH